jgi:voltage-gated potassium channel
VVTPERFRFATTREQPLRALGQRLMLAIALIVFVAGVCYVDRGGYTDNAGDGVSALDAVYYATVSVTTTGYGDIVPASESARLLTTLVVTPARVLFLILLVGTTIEVLASHSVFLRRMHRYRNKLSDHIVICGYGVKGRSALEFLRGSGEQAEAVVIDLSPEVVDAANEAGMTGIVGSGSDPEVLEAAEIERAKVIIVAPESDNEAVLVTLRARAANPEARIVAACREESNAKLLSDSGADSVVVSASAAGRMLGRASQSPDAAAVVTDLLSSGDGLEIAEREVSSSELGVEINRDETFLAVIRDGKLLRLSHPGVGALCAGDHLVYVKESS